MVNCSPTAAAAILKDIAAVAVQQLQQLQLGVIAVIAVTQERGVE